MDASVVFNALEQLKGFGKAARAVLDTTYLVEVLVELGVFK